MENLAGSDLLQKIFSKEVIIRAEDHEGKSLGLILVNPRLKQFHSSLRGQCKKALK